MRWINLLASLLLSFSLFIAKCNSSISCSVMAPFSQSSKLYIPSTKVVRIKKESPRDVTLQQGVENIWIFACFWSCWENPSKSLRAAEKNKEKVEANCTGFSAEFFGSQSVEMFCFARKTKIQMLTTSCRSLTRIHQPLFKSLGLYYKLDNVLLHRTNYHSLHIKSY